VVAAAAGTAPPARAGDWLITPRLEDQEIFTDNVFATPTDRRSDLITALSPGLSIEGASPRLTGKLDYSPTLYRYALTPSQDAVGHNLYARGTATLVPDLLFFDANAYASQQPTTPGLTTSLSSLSTAGLPATGLSSPLLPNAIPQAQLTQVTTVTASPYLQRRFGDYGVGELRYSFSDNNFSGGENLLLVPAPAASQNTSDTTNEATATFVTGSYFDRFTSRLLLDTSHSTGNDVLSNASQNRAIVATEYPLVHTISALTTIGYEDLRFGGVPTVQIDDAVWGVGARFAPTPDRTLTVLYGRHDGITSPYASLNYALTPLTRVTAGYSDSLTTFSEDIAQGLAASDLTARGQTIDSRTLLPLQIHNPLLGLQLSLLRIKRASAAVYLDNKRDHLSLSADREEDLVVAQAVTQPGVSLRATTINFGWGHDINPLTTAQLALGYSWVALLQAPEVDENIFTAGASLNYLFTPTLSGTASYTYFNRAANQPSFKLTSNVVLVSLRKTF